MKRLTTIVPAALAGLLLSACDASVYSLPLPGRSTSRRISSVTSAW